MEKISDENSAPELKPFRPLGKGLAPATQRDLLIHIQSMRHDVNFSLAQGQLLLLVMQSKLKKKSWFRWIEERVI